MKTDFKLFLLLTFIFTFIYSPIRSQTLGVVDANSNCQRIDSLSLVAFCKGLLDFDQWDLTKPVDTWVGVTLNENRCVSALDLARKNLKGTISPALGYLSNLISLDLSDNQLGGKIPNELGDLDQLKWLRLGNNQLTGSIPSQLGNMDNLQFLYVFNNKLNGSIPPELGNISSLNGLYASFNQLSGAMPAELGNLSKLSSLYLNNNELSDGIPATFANLKALKLLKIHHNKLSGCYPNDLNVFCKQLNSSRNNDISSGNNFPATWEDFCSSGQGSCIPTGCYQNDRKALESFQQGIDPVIWDMSKPMNTWVGVTLNQDGCVTRLSLNEKGLSGTLSPDLGKLSHLTTLSLYDNFLTGNIPAELGNLDKLTFLSLDNNQLSGNIPAELGNLKKLIYLWLYNNKLSGSIPAQLSSLSGLEDLRLQNNELTGGIPSELSKLFNLGILYLSNNELNGCYPEPLKTFCNQLLSIRNKDISEGNLLKAPWEDFCSSGDGICKPTVCQKDEQALIALHNATGGNNWIIKWNLEAPLNTWHGVTSNKDGCVTGLHLKENNLKGSIPPALGGLSNLQILDLAKNQLIGAIPAQLGNLSNLRELGLFNNQLTGSIPSQLGNLKNLSSLFLSYNQLSGTIPLQLGNLSNLRSLYLNNNELSGGIPATIGDLTALKNLRVHHNEMSGCYALNLRTLCSQLDSSTNKDISDGNNFDVPWEDFCRAPLICEPVWPGDFNYDGIANNADVLYWGLAKGNKSPVRENATSGWIAQDCKASGQSVNGINCKHQDADGNGIIDEQDLLVLESNYGETHTYGIPNNLGSGNMEYELLLLSEKFEEGVPFLVYGLKIKHRNLPSNLHGLAYTVSLSSSSYKIEEINVADSSLDPHQVFIRGTKTKKNVALTRTDRNNRICDDIVNIVVVTKDVPDFDNQLTITINSGYAILADGTIYNIPALIKEHRFKENRESQLTDEGYLMQNYPNPFANSTTIKYFIPVGVSRAAIQVLDISGKRVFTNPVRGNGQGEIQINTNALPPGIYTYLLNTNKGVSDVRKMVILK